MKPRRLYGSVQTALIFERNEDAFPGDEKWKCVLDAMMRHLLHRYGRTEIGTWRMELWFREDTEKNWEGMKGYFRLFNITYEVIHRYSEEIQVGGGGFRFLYDIQNVYAKFLEEWKKEPYFPDYLGFMDVLGMKIESREEFTDEDGTFNSYRAYLTAINAHHTMPVIISEYGVPSSRGRAQSDRNTGRSQGGMSEEEQGKALVQCYKDIMASGCAGSVAFTWQDEWFKRTWNTMAYTDLTKTCYWSDYQTNEQYFGILSFDPGEVESVCYVDGDVSEWEETDIVMETDTMSLSCKYDEKYIYFRVHKDDFHFGNETLYVPIDTTPKSGSTACDGIAPLFEQEADFVLIISGREDTKILVQERYEALRAVSYTHLTLPTNSRV